MSSYTLQSLTEGIRQRHVGVQNKRLVEKWARTGLLRGLNDVNRENMSQLLENQASQLLRESNTLGNDAVKGFTSIAFPIVRRVFGGLVANELVSIQPMSLPSGLLFYLDYTYGSNVGGDGTDAATTYKKGQSIYNNPTGKDIRTGSLATGGQYDLVGSGFSKLHEVKEKQTAAWVLSNDATGAFANAGNAIVVDDSAAGSVGAGAKKLLQYDSQIIDFVEEGGQDWTIIALPLSGLTNIDLSAFKDIAITNHANCAAIPQSVQSGAVLNVRRLNQLGTISVGGVFTANPFVETNTADAVVLCVVSGAAVAKATECSVSYIINDTFNNSSAETLVIPGFESDLGVRDAVDLQNPAGLPNPVIPEIDIKIESIPVTTSTRKLRARWSPELAQDLNAYHSLDAEVELTQILSEQIALEIDREILNDLLTQAQGANFFWSRAPGKFVNKRSGVEILRSSANNLLQPGPAFTGTVREWYETLIETIIDVANEIHRKTLRGSANYIIVSPDVATVLEASVLYRPAYSIDGDGQVATPFTMGAEKIGSLSNRFTVYKDPYFPRNKILVGYKGGSYLETGFVYAPYVPLIVTPTIFAPEDFTPRKGVMTRYGKKMVRADFYGTVTCLDMNII